MANLITAVLWMGRDNGTPPCWGLGKRCVLEITAERVQEQQNEVRRSVLLSNLLLIAVKKASGRQLAPGRSEWGGQSQLCQTGPIAAFACAR